MAYVSISTISQSGRRQLPWSLSILLTSEWRIVSISTISQRGRRQLPWSLSILLIWLQANGRLWAVWPSRKEVGGSYLDLYLYFLFGYKWIINWEVFYHLVQDKHIWMSHLIDDETWLLQYKRRDSSMSISAIEYPRYPISIIRFQNTLQKKTIITSQDNHKIKGVCKYNIQVVQVSRKNITNWK